MKFQPTFESLREYECPDWFRDAKFGIWSHWGPQSVPMYGDWYARNMYREGEPQYLCHLRNYGHPSEFGYKDLCKLWKAENFNPDELMELYHKAGARYFVAQAMHHDNFFNYATKLNRFNSVEIGPMKDICELWQSAAKKYSMPFGLTEHLSAAFTWWNTNKRSDKSGPYKGVPYDGNDPEYKDLYFDNAELANMEYDAFAPKDYEGDFLNWYADNQEFHEYWLKVMDELIEKFEPDLLYSDGGIPFGHPDSTNDFENYKTGLETISKLYNKSIEKHGKNRAVYNQKDRREEVYTVGVLDIERSQLPDILPHPWQTDTCTGVWFYDVRQEYKKPGHIVEILVDIISKNGNLLLNVLQRPDGTLDFETKYILEELAKWFAVCSDGVYATRPWKVSGEGKTKVFIDGFTEDKTEWDSSDYRFTAKGDKVYAFMLKAPENGVAILTSFMDENVKSVRLLGVGEVPFSQKFGLLTVQLPKILPTEYTNCLEITLD